MKKVICLIRQEPPLIYFANRINQNHSIALAVIEQSPDNESILSKIRARGLFGAIDAAKNRILNISGRGMYNTIHVNYFEDQWQFISKDMPVLHVDDINSQKVYDRLMYEKPDLILDHGTSIVKNHILEIADLSLNLHWGLSPYYRGTYCTDWALINWDPYNIGVTIHKLSRIIDGGSILAQKRAVIRPDDTVPSINLQLTKLGTDLIIRIIEKIERGESLQFFKQDLSAGYLIRNIQWSSLMQKQIDNIMKNNLLASMLKKPSRKQKLPIIDL